MEEGEGHVKMPSWRMMSSRNCSLCELRVLATYANKALDRDLGFA